MMLHIFGANAILQNKKMTGMSWLDIFHVARARYTCNVNAQELMTKTLKWLQSWTGPVQQCHFRGNKKNLKKFFWKHRGCYSEICERPPKQSPTCSGRPLSQSAVVLFDMRYTFDERPLI